MFNLTATHLRFVCEATTPLRLEVDAFRAGQNLRGALGQVMTRTYCAGDQNDPSHAATCPVHWLLTANEKPGQERRGYTIVPPASEPASGLKPGDRFEFGLTLFGNALKFLPYFVLAIPEIGRSGVGAGRGKFTLKGVWAENPLTRERECLLAEGDNLVHTPTQRTDHAQVRDAADRVLRSMGERDFHLTIQFITPTRLIEAGTLAQTPAFGVLFARMLKRLDDLEEQHGGGAGRPAAEIELLQEMAEQVRLIETKTRWVEVTSGSTRRGMPSPLSGLVGWARYAAPMEAWRSLMPWLIWGQLAQVGKDTVKGNGVVQIVA